MDLFFNSFSAINRDFMIFEPISSFAYLKTDRHSIILGLDTLGMIENITANDGLL